MKHKVVGKQYNSRMCFVCGFKNTLGLQTEFFELENKEVCALVTFKDEHQSYPGRLHGGVSSAILDETIGRAIMRYTGEEVWGVTMTLNLRYRKPVPIGEQLRVVGRITFTNGKFFEGRGELLLSDGSVAVSAEGKYLQLPIKDIAELNPDDEKDWSVCYTETDPREIELPY